MSAYIDRGIRNLISQLFSTANSLPSNPSAVPEIDAFTAGPRSNKAVSLLETQLGDAGRRRFRSIIDERHIDPERHDL